MSLKEALKALVKDEEKPTEKRTAQEMADYWLSVEPPIEETKAAYRFKAHVELEAARRNLEAAERW